MKRLYKLTKSVLLTIPLLGLGIGIGAPYFNSNAEALSGSQFEAGRIIDDGLFYNGNTMTVNQIQNFLNAKVPLCDSNGTQPYGGTTRKAYAASKGVSTPFICLKSFKQNTPFKAGESGLCAAITAKSNQTAAQIIDSVASACSISEKVLLVMLQKEQGLVTDDWPWPIQYTKAMGYYCPDDPNNPGWCHPDYAGFFNQVYNAARQFQRYKADPNNWNHIPFATNNILYQANAPSCGTRSVYIENYATAGLYNYTPYTPNSAALNNLYGTGNSCSAYGNRNFWRYYNDWFGPTQSTAWNYSFVSSSSSNVWLQPDMKRVGHYIVIKNTGSEAWYADGAIPPGKFATRLALRGYKDSPFADVSDPNWLGTKNQIKMSPSVVEPGENAIFIFNLVGPNKMYESPYTHNFVPIVNGVTSMRDIDMQMRFTNIPPPYSYVTSTGLSPNLYPNQRSGGSITIKNTGAVTWYADGAIPPGKFATRLALRGYKDSPFADVSDPNWLGTKNQIKMSPSVVEPGENAIFTFSLKGPLEEKYERMHFIPILDGITFMKDISMFYVIKTPQPMASYEFVTATNPPKTMSAGSTAQVTLVLKNKGTIVWSPETNGAPSLRIMMDRPAYRSSDFYDSSLNSNWLTPNQIKYTGNQTGFNGLVTLTFNWKAPATPGVYTEYFRPVLDGYEVLQDKGLAFTVEVTP